MYSGKEFKIEIETKEFEVSYIESTPLSDFQLLDI
ncbi:uncharacterized protein METZ01_LOCUS469921 [marine metagenome]|uniref:Uncharacterized protein n=1 Tax=marine metagenome TaxID=408172 RepID=A0A383BAB2_9ZZZZ